MKISDLIIEEISNLTDISKYPFVNDIYKNNGNIYYVGGYVRDSFLGKDSKDIDVLVTGIPMELLENILKKYGNVNNVGQSFGVLKFIPSGTNIDLDVAIPRTEKSTGNKYTDFEVESDHTLPIDSDLFRRDFSINAIARDFKGNIIDPYGGVNDIKNKVIRMVNPDAFADDPLRMLRAIQFSSRFGFTIEPKTLESIKNNADKIKNITSERILIEFDKIVKKGDPIHGINNLINTGLYEILFNTKPNINKLINLSKIKTIGEFIFSMLYGNITNIDVYFKQKLKGDIDNTTLIKSIDYIFTNFKNNRTNNFICLYNANKINNTVLDSEIFPENILNTITEFKKYPKTIKELDINGNDIMKLGYKGADIGKINSEILVAIYSDKIKNKKQDIINYILNEKG